MLSTTSSVFLIPAVSIRLRVTPDRLIISSRVSLVVPSISVTIALSSLASTLSRLDFPALVFPKMTVRTPSCMILPLSHVFNKLSTLLRQFSTSFLRLFTLASISKCSGSSSAASINATLLSIISLIFLIFSDNLPSN